MVATIKQFNAPTELDHTQIRRGVDIYVRPEQEDLGRIATQIHHILDTTQTPHGIEATLLGSVESMNVSFRSFAVGLILSVVLFWWRSSVLSSIRSLFCWQFGQVSPVFWSRCYCGERL
jgi:multidrug efflux pump subunit AcrB